MQSKRACARCRSAKLKCNKALPTCGRCENAGHSCVYAVPDKSLRIRDQTDKAERHAVSAWRARTSKASSRDTVPRRQPDDLKRPLATDVKILAQHRFLYDFSEKRTSLSSMFFGEMISTEIDQRDTSGVKYAFIATSLANFHARHRDSRAASLAASFLSRALIILRRSLDSSHGEMTPDLPLMAILLGLHENISHDKHLTGSWIHHFRGSVNLLQMATARGLEGVVFTALSKLIEKQALCVALLLELPYPLPLGMRKRFSQKTDIRSRTLSLAAQTADYCAISRRPQDRTEPHQLLLLRESFESLDDEFTHLEYELSDTLAYSIQPAETYAYPEWYRVISNFPSGPSFEHSYSCLQDVATWNTARMARTKLYSVVLEMQLYPSVSTPTEDETGTPELPFQETLISKFCATVEDTCASVLSSLSQRVDGVPPIFSFNDIPGAKGYALITPLQIAQECMERLPTSELRTRRIDWIVHVLEVIRENLGVSSAWCWSTGDETAARLKIERELTFEG